MHVQLLIERTHTAAIQNCRNKGMIDHQKNMKLRLQLHLSLILSVQTVAGQKPLHSVVWQLISGLLLQSLKPQQYMNLTKKTPRYSSK